MEPQPAARVAYVAYAFPVLTQTFTTREVRELRRCGMDITAFAVRSDRDASLDPEANEEQRRACYLPSPGSAGSIAAALGWLVRRPIRFATTLFACLGGDYAHDAAKFRLRAIGHAFVGAALADELRRRGGFVRVHAQFVDAGSTVAYVAARLLDLRFSFTNHTAYNPFCLRPKTEHADRMFSISEFDRGLLAAVCADGDTRIAIHRVGIDPADWERTPRRPEAGRILSVAGLREKKGNAVLLRAAARLREDGRDVTLVIAGSGPEEARLRELAVALDVPTEFLGAVGPAQVREQLSRAAVFCLACCRAANGDIDGIPVALMEAMAASVPVVSTRLSGIPELIPDGECGRLAEPGDDVSLAAALAATLDAPDEAARMVVAARDRVARQHDLEGASRLLAEALARGMSTA